VSRATKKKLGRVGLGELFLAGVKGHTGVKKLKCANCCKSDTILFYPSYTSK